MYTKVNSVAVRGIQGLLVSVEADVSLGLPEFSMVGFLSSEVKEARERVRTSLRNAGFALAPRRITVNLSPADVRKEGTAFDLAVALGILEAYGCLPPGCLDGLAVMGELGLDGGVRPVPGILSMVLAARQAGLSACLVPQENQREGSLVEGIAVVGVRCLSEAVEQVRRPGFWKGLPGARGRQSEPSPSYPVDFAEVKGQAALRRAAEVAAAGMHNLLLVGPPGAGKTMIARRLPTILPPLTRQESLEVTQIYSVCGLLPADTPLLAARPFRSPHHTCSAQALVGGGRIPRPGEISLAHRGVLFLDELPEFSQNALEVLRQPLEDRQVHISRVHGAYTFPADCMVAAAMNPCRCGYYPDRSRCQCSEAEVRRYQGRVSRPLLDRMDLCVEAAPVAYQDMQSGPAGEPSAAIRRRVEAAWQRQRERFSGTGIYFNSQMAGALLEQFCRLGPKETALMEQAFQRLGLSARAYHRILRVARTLADLEGEPEIRERHLGEAAGYRGWDTCGKEMR